MADSELDDLLSESKLIRQRIEARKNSSPTAVTSGKSSNSKVNQFDWESQNQSTVQNDSFPILIGNLEELELDMDMDLPGFLEVFLQTIAVIRFISMLPFLPFIYLFNLFLQWKYEREYAQNKLNPAYLRGTGLMVYSDLSAELITKGEVPRHMFEKEEVTCINHHSFIMEGGGLLDVEIRIHLHEFHALTLYGLGIMLQSRDIVAKLVSLYDVEVQYTSETRYWGDGDGGGGGG